MKITKRMIITVALAATCPALATADVPTNMNIQCRLTDTSGTPAPPGIKLFTFKIFDQASGGTEIWPAGTGETQALVTDADGLWTAAVGALIPLTAAVFQDTSRWLQILVDDGFGPPDTLSRIKFNTSPFTYRAATAQQADAVGGSTLSDLEDQFVDVAGDTMSGILTVNAPNKAGVGASLSGTNINDAHSPVGLATNTIGILGHAASDGTEGKFGVLGWSDGQTGNTIGVYGQGNGTGNLNIGVYGFVTEAGAASDYSGFFWGGDLAVNSPATPGDSSVRLPANSISSAETLNEPGISQGTLFGNFFADGLTVMTDVVTTTLTTPTAGYIVVEASGTMFFSSTTLINLMDYQIDETAGGTSAGPSQQAGLYSPPNTSLVIFSGVARRTYFKGSAGTYTFRLEAKDNSLSGTKGFFNPTITAWFVPTGYGTVNTVVAADDAGRFESAQAVAAVGAPGQADASSGESAYRVDLRELELRVARARAEADRAELALLKAQLKPGRPAGSQEH